MDTWVILASGNGFRQLLHFDDKDISTEYSALMSKVMQNGNGGSSSDQRTRRGRRKSQIEEYLVTTSRLVCNTWPSLPVYLSTVENFATTEWNSCACLKPITKFA